MKSHNDVLGIGLESSCDETAVAVVKNGREILSNIIFSQIDIHREYSGVVPEIASRAHLDVINNLIDEALTTAGVDFGDIDYAAATNKPGLIGSLLIATQSAKAISYTMNIPLIAINHLEAHLYAPFLEGHDLLFPYIGLLVSGGNTVLFHVRGIGNLEIIGKTVDDAVGEAFDKVSKYLGLGYPGGPVIEKTARNAVIKKPLFPKLLADAPEGDFRFSYSGLKTAVITYMKDNPHADTSEVVYSFQERALEILVRRVFAAARATGIKQIVVAGGVAANGRLREMLRDAAADEFIIIPSPLLCTDNAAMVAGLGYRYFTMGIADPLSTDISARL